MPKWPLRLTIAFLLAAAQVTAADPLSKSIDRGIESLLKDTKGHLSELRDSHGTRSIPGNRDSGRLALQLYGLVVAGVSVDHPTVSRGFKFLEKLSLNWTYATCCYIFALDAAIAQVENDLLMLSPEKIRKQFRDDPRIGKRFRPRLETAVKVIVKSQNKLGAWRYGTSAQDYDNSVTQFAVLALGVGAKRHIRINPAVWEGVLKHFSTKQEAKGPTTKKRLTLDPIGESRRDRVEISSRDDDEKTRRSSANSRRKKPKKGKTGVTEVKEEPDPQDPVVGTERLKLYARGWNYTDGGAKWPMTCAGLSSLLLVRDNVSDRLSATKRRALNKAIRDGYGWMMHHWQPTGTFYNMYSLEKVGDLGHVLKFGDDDWYATLEKHLLKSQKDDGSWIGSGHEEKEPGKGTATAFALLILNRATSLLTQSPASRIIVSGRSAPKGDLSDRSWVYVPDLDTTLHYPSLLRAIRLRPSPKLIKFLRNIVDNYPAEWKGELIPDLAKIRDAVPNRSARKVLHEYLEDITGYDYKDPKEYLEWHRRWTSVIEMAKAGKEDKIPDLLKYYREATRSMPLRQTIMLSLTRLKAREAVPLFLADLDHKNSRIRLAAYRNFKAFYIDFPPPFDPGASALVRRNQVTAIQEWYLEHLDG